jgi:tetratricopeptide (TPR) repeat protein
LIEASHDFFDGGTPRWILAFQDSPDAALRTLVRDEASLGHLSGADAVELLSDWVQLLGPDSQFALRLDMTAARWIQAEWGRLPSRDSAEVGRIAHSWGTMCRLVRHLPAASHAAAGLRQHWDERNFFLGPLTTGPSQDPLGGYLRTVAHTQCDRQLAPAWWYLCDLPPDVRWWHGRIGVLGIRRLPREDPRQPVGFRYDVAAGLVAYADGLARGVETERLSERHARDELAGVFETTVNAFPFDDWSTDLASMRSTVMPLAGRWLSEMTGVEPAAIEQKIRHIPRANGGHDFVVELCRRSEHDRRTNPDAAVKQALKARDWEPWNHYTWGALGRALSARDGVGSALSVLWVAYARFPENPFALQDLGAALRLTGQLDLAVEIFRQGTLRFPTDLLPQVGLGETYVALGATEHAIEVFERMLAAAAGHARTPKGVSKAVLNLARIRRDSGDAPGARTLLTDGLSRFPDADELVNVLAHVDDFLAEESMFEHHVSHVKATDAHTQLTAEAVVARGRVVRHMLRGRIERGEELDADRVHANTALEALMPKRQDPRVRAEIMLLRTDLRMILPAESGSLADVVLSDEELYADARGRRNDAVVAGDVAFDLQHVRDMTVGVRELASRVPAARALLALTEARASAALVDGPARLEAVETALAHFRQLGTKGGENVSKLDESIRARDSEGSFTLWWSPRVVDTVNGLSRHSRDLATSRDLDLFEEDFVGRMFNPTPV